MLYKTLIYKKEDNMAYIQFNRPKSMNAINSEFIIEFRSVLNDAAVDKDIRAVIVSGSDDVFVAGADIKELTNTWSPFDSQEFGEAARFTIKKLEDLKKPTIAAIAGFAFGGGCELALACDIRIAAENAAFALPEIKLGILPGAGGTQRLPRLIGVGRAKQMLFSGDPIDAHEAYRIGLVNKVVPVNFLLKEAKEMADRFACRPACALSTIKGLVNEGMSMDLNSALAHEAKCFEILFSTEDQKEGMRAFLEKRQPLFKHR